MSVQTKPFITPEEYLERERAAEFKSEYYNGEVFAMSGGSRNHVKFEFYRSIASLREYVLVAQDRRSVEGFRKNEEGHWVLYEADTEQGTIEMALIGCTLKLDDLYANVTFDAASTT